MTPFMAKGRMLANEWGRGATASQGRVMPASTKKKKKKKALPIKKQAGQESRKGRRKTGSLNKDSPDPSPAPTLPSTFTHSQQSAHGQEAQLTPIS
jgi:hypothetical protein